MADSQGDYALDYSEMELPSSGDHDVWDGRLQSIGAFLEPILTGDSFPGYRPIAVRMEGLHDLLVDALQAADFGRHLPKKSRVIAVSQFMERGLKHLETVRSHLESLQSPTISDDVRAIRLEALVNSTENASNELRKEFVSLFPSTASARKAASDEQPELTRRVRGVEKRLRQQEGQVEELSDLIAQLQQRLEENSGLGDRVQSILGDTEQALAVLRSREPVFVELLGEFQNSKARAAFQQRSQEHRVEEEQNAQRFFLALLALAGVIAWTLSTPIPDYGAPALIAVGARRLIVILLAGLAARITLRRWNIERHLRILYDHRVASIEQLDRILASMPDASVEEKSRLRREASLMFLKDPATGYLDHESSDISITPLVTAVDKAATRLS